MRRSLLTRLIEATAENLRFRDRVALFELGSVYHARADRELPDEPRRVALVMTGPADVKSWRGGGATPRALDFYDAKGVVESLLARLEVPAEWEAGQHPSTYPGRTAIVRSETRSLGHVGELHPRVREQWGLGDGSVVIADLDLEAIEAAGGVVRPFKAFSAFPAVKRDLAVVVPEAVSAGEVADLIRRTGGKLLVDLELFDLYRGRQIGSGNKSLAYSLSFQAKDKTLEGKVADGFRGRIIKALEDAFDAEPR